MNELYTAVDIYAPPARVWRFLIDFENYPNWNPYLRHVSGPLTIGTKLKVSAHPSGKAGRTFWPILLKVAEGRELRWVGRLLLPGLLDGEHIFTIEAVTENHTRFIHREEFSGILVPFHHLFRFQDTKRGFEEMNQALKMVAEKE